MWVPYVTVFLFVSLIVIWIMFITYSRRKNQKIYDFMSSTPGPIAVPVLGNIFLLSKHLFFKSKTLVRRLMYEMKKWDKKRGAYWILDRPVLLTSDRLIFKAVLQSPTHISKTEDYKSLKGHSSGIVTTNGDAWRKMRRMINPAFRNSVLWSPTHVKNFDYHTEIFLNTLREHAKNGEKFDLLTTVHSCNLDMICDNLLGHRVDIQKKNLSFYSKNMMRSSEIIFERFFRFILWPKCVFSLSGMKYVMKNATKPMRILISKIIDEKLEQKIKSVDTAITNADSLKSYIEILVDNISSGELSRQQAIMESIDLFVAASITNSMVASWIFIILAKRPDIHQKVYEEIVEVCGQEVTLNDVSKLLYLDMVIKEALRHFTIPFVTRFIEEDITLEDNTTLPAGLNIVLFIFDLHHNPEYWQKPGEFYPEHFSPVNELNRPDGVFLPFLAGPRVCPGKKYSETSMKYWIAKTLLRYEFLTDEKLPDDFTTADYICTFALCPVSGFQVKVQERMLKIQTTSPSPQ